jgi:hypothetical protein
MGTQRTIALKGCGVRKERVASEIITPGQLVEILSTDKVGRHNTALGRAQRAVAVEDDLQGKEVSETYASAAIVQYNVFQPGDEVQVRIKNGEDIHIGDMLESDGDGALQKLTTGYALFIALEDVDMSNSSGADPEGLCIAEVM